MDPNGILLCACGAAYAISASDGSFTPDTFYYPKVGFTSEAVAVFAGSEPNEALINACLVGPTTSGIIVAFRGTLLDDTVASFEDWLQDCFVDPITVPGITGKVHSGFATAVGKLFQGILTEIRKLRGDDNTPVYVTGHSKGGGMAPMFAYLLHDAGITAAEVVTFAAPMSGDGDFAAAYDALISKHTRFEDFGDLVPMLPPSPAFVTTFLSWIKPYKSEIPDWLYKLFESAGAWDYTAVGQEEYICSSWFDYELVSNESIDNITSGIAVNIVGYYFDVEEALMSAHTVQCGFGYMIGVCGPMQCPLQSDDVASMPRVGPPKIPELLKARAS